MSELVGFKMERVSIFQFKCGWSAILPQFQVYRMVIQYFCWLNSIIGYFKVMAIIPCAIQYIPGVYFMYSSLYLLIPYP